jgi:hypothetical protein
LIYWEDFLRFLESEANLREMINDMRINQDGSTRLVEKHKYRIKNLMKQITKQSALEDNIGEEGTTSYIIDQLELIELPDFKLLLCVFESKDIELIDFDTFGSIHKFKFKSTYTKPKVYFS